MGMNEQLFKYQELWFKDIFDPYAKNNPKISYPFFTGVSDEYEKADRKIMIVGQETQGWGQYESDWTLEDSRQRAIDYLRYQLKYQEPYTDELKAEGIPSRRNSSAFWSFFKQFSWYDYDIVPCWNNVNKAQTPKSHKLSSDSEQVFNSLLPGQNKTLFQKEVEILKPDVIVFITGPNYATTMEVAMNLKEGSLQNIKPSHQKYCIDISSVAELGVPTFWTYHPTHISRSKELTRTDRDKIIDYVKQGFNRTTHTT